MRPTSREARRDPAGMGSTINKYEQMVVSLVNDYQREVHKALLRSQRKLAIDPTVAPGIRMVISDLTDIGKVTIETPGSILASDLASFSYRKGAKYAEMQAKTKGIIISMATSPTDPAIISIIEAQNFAALKGISDEMARRITYQLTQGVSQGESIPNLTRRVYSAVDMGRSRARMIARTEAMRGFNQGALQRYEQQGFEYVEWLTSSGCCEDCEELGSQDIGFGRGVYPIDAVPDIPYHPNCRCATAPYVEPVGEGIEEPEGEEGEINERAERARESYKPADKEAQDIATANQQRLADAINGEVVGGKKPFDVFFGDDVAIEVKTIVRGDNDKITMHPDSLTRKRAQAAAMNWNTHTVVFDQRTNQIYYKKGLGSFRLTSMSIVTLQELHRLLV